MREKLLSRMTPEWHACYEAGMFTEFMEQRGPGHTCGGEQVFTTGYMDYKEKIRETMEGLDYFNDAEALDKCEELKAMDIACDAVLILGERYRRLALEMAETEKDETRKGELLQIAANLRLSRRTDLRHTGRRSSCTGSPTLQLPQNLIPGMRSVRQTGSASVSVLQARRGGRHS